jgi:hypothetical protein
VSGWTNEWMNERIHIHDQWKQTSQPRCIHYKFSSRPIPTQNCIVTKHFNLGIPVESARVRRPRVLKKIRVSTAPSPLRSTLQKKKERNGIRTKRMEEIKLAWNEEIEDLVYNMYVNIPVPYFIIFIIIQVYIHRVQGIYL